MLCRQMLEQIFVVAEKAELTIFQTFAKQHTSHLIHLIGHSDIAGPCPAREGGHQVWRRVPFRKSTLPSCHTCDCVMKQMPLLHFAVGLRGQAGPCPHRLKNLKQSHSSSDGQKRHHRCSRSCSGPSQGRFVPHPSLQDFVVDWESERPRYKPQSCARNRKGDIAK